MRAAAEQGHKCTRSRRGAALLIRCAASGFAAIGLDPPPPHRFKNQLDDKTHEHRTPWPIHREHVCLTHGARRTHRVVRSARAQPRQPQLGIARSIATPPSLLLPLLLLLLLLLLRRVQGCCSPHLLNPGL